MTSVEVLPGEGVGGFGVAGAVVLRPDAMPAGLAAGYERACAEVGLEDPPAGGVAVWALYAPKADGSGLGRLSMVTTLVNGTAMAIAEWADGIVVALPDPDDRDVLHMAEGWTFERFLRPHPVYQALGWHGVCARAIRHPPPDTSGGEHHPIQRFGRGAQQGVWAVGCEDCAWSQRVDDEALDNGAGRLLAWHAAYPTAGVDHMGGMPPHYRLAIPDYAEGTAAGPKHLVVRDRRTGLVHHRPRRAAVEVYETLGAGQRLAPPGYLPDHDIMGALADLFEWGLLAPKPTDPPRPVTPATDPRRRPGPGPGSPAS